MTRYRWADTNESVLGEVPEYVDEDVGRLASMLERLAAEGEAMSVVEWDGFAAGLAVQAKPVPSSEWIRHVRGPDTRPERDEEIGRLEAALLDYSESVARTLAETPGRYAPVLEVNESTEQVYWKPWIAGFARAMRLHPTAWAHIEGSDELDALESVQVGRTLFAAASGKSTLEAEALDLLDSLAPLLIGGMVRDFHAIA